MKKLKFIFYNLLVIVVIIWSTAFLSNIHAHVSNQNTSYSIGFEFEKGECEHIENEDSPYLLIAIPSPLYQSKVLLSNSIASIVKSTRSKIYSIFKQY